MFSATIVIAGYSNKDKLKKNVELLSWDFSEFAYRVKGESGVRYYASRDFQDKEESIKAIEFVAGILNKMKFDILKTEIVHTIYSRKFDFEDVI